MYVRCQKSSIVTLTKTVSTTIFFVVVFSFMQLILEEVVSHVNSIARAGWPCGVMYETLMKNNNRAKIDEKKKRKKKKLVLG